MRSGFSMLTAIFIMVFIATVMVLMISLSTTSVDRTTNIYLKEQSRLMARSATEYALLAASGHDYSGNCLENIDMDYNGYAVNMQLRYIGNGLNCNDAHTIDDNITTADSNGTVIIDTRVSFPARPDQNVTYTRRTIQKL